MRGGYGSQVDLGELVRWAEANASAQLSDMGDRWKHVQAVAARAQTAGQALDTEEDRAALLAAAWLHDVGYAPGVAATGFHPLDGARHVRRLGQERVAGLVAHHSAANAEAAL